MSFTEVISINEPIGDSLVKINSNFTSIDTRLRLLSTGQHLVPILSAGTIVLSSVGYYESVFSTGERITELHSRVAGVVDQITTTLAAKCCSVRLSHSNTDVYEYTDTSTSDIYLHPCNGNQVSLYKASINDWLVYEINTVYKFSLRKDSTKPTTPILGRDTVVAVFLYWEDDTFKLYYEYLTTVNIKTTFDLNKIITYVDNVAVLKTSTDKRFIGVVRINNDTTGASTGNISNISLVNVYNRIETAVCSASSLNLVSIDSSKTYYNVSLQSSSFSKAYILINGAIAETLINDNTTLTTASETFTVQLNPGVYNFTLSADNYNTNQLFIESGITLSQSI